MTSPPTENVGGRASTGSCDSPIAFLFPAFPVLHQTFVLWEVLELRRRGIPIVIYSMKRPGTATQQPEGQALSKEVCYLPQGFSFAIWFSNLKVFARAPRRYLGVFPRLIRAWWSDRWLTSRRRSGSEAEKASLQMLTLPEKLLVIYNTSPFLYLLKSLLLVFQAAHLGLDLQRAGICRLHAHWSSFPATVALIVRWLFDIPYSFTAHAYDIYVVPRLLSEKIAHAEFVVTCAHTNARFLRDAARGFGNVIVNYHGVDLDRFSPREAQPEGTVAYVVTCGRLQVYKGHHVLLQACSRLQRPFQLVIIGEGPQRATLERLARHLRIAEHVIFTGPLPQSEVAGWYAKAHVFVLASVAFDSTGKRDVIPNVLAEAMAMKVPVIATRVSGIGELVDDGENGLLVPAGDAEALAAAIEKLLGDRELRHRFAEAGHRKVRQQFDRSVNVAELAKLFS